MVSVYIFVALIAILLIIAAFMPKIYTIERSIVIDRSVPDVMKYVGDFNHYASWNPWQKMEIAATKTITGEPFTIGHRYEWRGKKIGRGSLTLKAKDEQRINIDIQFLRPWKSRAKDNWLFETENDGRSTKITWQNTGELPWPTARLMGPLVIKNLNHQFGKGLENLKEACENLQA